jgi:hypothetical protein
MTCPASARSESDWSGGSPSGRGAPSITHSEPMGSPFDATSGAPA